MDLTIRPVQESDAAKIVASLSWKKAIALSLATVYGPYLVMALGMTAFVACTHCKATAWWLFPFAPGIIPVELAFREFVSYRPDDIALTLLGLIVSAAIVLLPASLLRHPGWVRILLCVVQFLLHSYCAIALTAAIRA